MAKYQDINSDIKDLHNKIFANSLRSYDKVFILDGSENRTVKAIYTIYNSAEYVPEIHCAERDYETYLQMKQNNLCDVQYMDAEDYLLHHYNFTAAYLDFMGTITGNQSTGDNPLIVLKNLLTNTKDLHTLCLTFSTRWKYKNNSPIHHDYLNKYLIPVLTKYGYEIDDTHEDSPYIELYNRPGGQRMIFFSLRLKYNKSTRELYKSTKLAGLGYDTINMKRTRQRKINREIKREYKKIDELNRQIYIFRHMLYNCIKVNV